MDNNGDLNEDRMDVPEMVEGYEKPRPPLWKKRDVFVVEQMKELDDKARKVAVTTRMNFGELANTLTKGLENDLKKVRALFIWLSNQDIKGAVYPNDIDCGTPMGFMKLIKNKQGTYAEFFALLCRAANIPCVIIRGHCKGISYEVGDQDVNEYQVSWNSVLIDGSWQIIHPLWAFSAVSGFDTGKWTQIETEGKGTRVKAKARKGVSVRQIDENYFLPHPDEFIYECIAHDKMWQLLEEPWDPHKFCNVPHFQLDYFTSDYKLTSQHKAILFSMEGKCEMVFTQKENTVSDLTYELFFDENHSKEKLPVDLQLPRTVFFETNENILRLIVRFNVVGIYKLVIKAAGITIVEVRLEATEKSENKNMFPANPPIGFGFGQTAKNKGIMDPSHKSGVVVTQRNRVETFSFTMKKITEILAVLRHNKRDQGTLSKYVAKTIKGNAVSIKVTMPDDTSDEEYALQVYLQNDRLENNVLNYLLTNRQEDFDAEPQKVKSTQADEKQNVRNNIQEKRIRRNLTTALAITKTFGALERSVTEFEEARLKDSDGQFRKAKTLLEMLKNESQANYGMKHLKLKLKTAITKRNLEDLENAVRKAEQARYTELEELVATAKDLVIELEQEEIDTARESYLRRQLKEATEGQDMKELENAIREFQDENISDEGDLKKAQKALSRLYEEVLQDAMSRDDLTGLEQLLREKDKSVIAKQLQESTMMKRTERFYKQQKRINGHLSNILELKSSTVAEIHGYKNPKRITQDIMRASFILLGKNPKTVETWKSIQKYLKSSGDVVRKIKTVKKESLHDITIKWADQYLGRYTTDDVREVSAGVAAFYRWSNNMIQERRDNSDA